MEKIIFLVKRANLAQKLGFTLDAIEILHQVQNSLNEAWKYSSVEEREKILSFGLNVSQDISRLWFRLQKEKENPVVFMTGEDR